jgi:hypothetical protein
MKRSSQHRVQTPQKGLSASGRSPGVRTRSRHRRRSWRTRSMVVRVMRGRLLMGAAVLGKSMPSRRVHQVVPQVVRQTRVVIMQHWTRNRTILRGTRNRHDTGLFQMNTVV